MVFSWSSLQFRINLNKLLFFPIAENIVIWTPFEIWFWVCRWEKFNITIFDNIFWAFICISVTSVNNIVSTISKDNSLWFCVVDLNVAAILIEYDCIVSHYCSCYVVIIIYIHIHYPVFFKKWSAVVILIIIILTVYNKYLYTEYEHQAYRMPPCLILLQNFHFTNDYLCDNQFKNI